MLLGIDFTGSRGHLCDVVILFLSYTGGRLWGGGPLSGENRNSAVSSSEHTVDPVRPTPNCYPFSERADTPQPLMDLSGWWVQAYGSVRQPLKEQTPSTLCGRVIGPLIGPSFPNASCQ